ncbi:hypothetical protein GCM10020216_079510 [Nonomuraea helvata]
MVGQLSAQHLGTGVGQGLGGLVRAGQREDGVPAGEELGDDGGADGAGAARDKDMHETLPK